MSFMARVEESRAERRVAEAEQAAQHERERLQREAEYKAKVDGFARAFAREFDPTTFGKQKTTTARVYRSEEIDCSMPDVASRVAAILGLNNTMDLRIECEPPAADADCGEVLGVSTWKYCATMTDRAM